MFSTSAISGAGRNRLTRLITCAICAASAALFPQAARAGSFDVLSCGLAPAGGSDDAWVFETDAPGNYESSRVCPPSAGQAFSGLVGWDRLGVPGPPPPRFGHWRLAAPPGTTLTSARLMRYIGKRNQSFRLYVRTASGAALPGETCDIPIDQFLCEVGGPGTPASQHAVDTTSLAIGFECFSTPTTCTTGATLHEVWAVLYGAQVTISDPSAPTVGPASGDLFAGGHVKGQRTASLNASDNTGIKAMRVVADGAPVAASEIVRSCDYSRVLPCSNPPAPMTLTFSTHQLADGAHQLQLGALDAAGNEARTPAQGVTVDNTPPDAPLGLRSSVGTAIQGSRRLALSWTNPGGQVSPITEARWTVCPRYSIVGCQTGSVPVTGIEGSVPRIVLPRSGTYAASVLLVDEAGNLSGANAAYTSVRYRRGARAPSRLRITSARRSARGRLVTVMGRIAPNARRAITVRYSARVRGHRRSMTRRVRPRQGAWKARFELRGAWRRGVARVVRARYPGSAMIRAGRASRRVRTANHPVRPAVRRAAPRPRAATDAIARATIVPSTGGRRTSFEIRFPAEPVGLELWFSGPRGCRQLDEFLISIPRARTGRYRFGPRVQGARPRRDGRRVTRLCRGRYRAHVVAPDEFEPRSSEIATGRFTVR